MRHRFNLRGGPLLAAALLVAAAPGAWAQQSTPVEAPTEHIGTTPFVMQGFGDVNYLASAPEPEHGGFQNGALDLFVTARLSDRWSALAELVFETEGNAFTTDLERFQFTFEQSDALRISAGRIHNPFLRWPMISHHGLFNQTPVDRPIIARWEDEPGLWPMHFVGLLVHGRFSNAMGLSYEVGVGNGRGKVLDEIQMGVDQNDQRAIVAAFGVNPDAVPGLAVHVSGYFDRIPSEPTSLRERDYAMSATYVRGDIELRGEWSRMNHELVDSDGEYQTTGWYVLAAYRLSEQFARIKPYLLIENLDAAEDEAFLEGAVDEEAWAAGVRWDANRWVALKADYRSRRLENMNRDGVVRAQMAVSF